MIYSVAGIRTLRSCGANLLFDRLLGDCNIATAVKCVRDPVILMINNYYQRTSM